MKSTHFLGYIFMLYGFHGLPVANSNFQDDEDYITSPEYAHTFGDNLMLGSKSDSSIPNVKRGLDIYRFFRLGLGKRQHNSAQLARYSTDKEHVFSNQFNLPYKLRSVLNNVLSEINHHQGVVTQRLRSPQLYTHIENNAKRVPEIFQEEFYPIQAGKQQMEATIDSSLNNVAFNTNADMIAHQSDILFPDQILQRFNKGFMQQSQQNKEENSNFGLRENPVQKRWWAASRLQSFRNPKASRSFRRKHYKGIDPVLYFIGLGR